jgi:AraC-like DNA-binding protein
METDITKIDLKLLSGKGEKVYSYRSGHICILFSRSGEFGFEYMGRRAENALPAHSNYLMCMHMGDFELKFFGSEETLMVLDLPVDLLHQLVLDQDLNVSDEQKNFLQSHMIHKLSANSSQVESCLDQIVETMEHGTLSPLLLQSKKLELLSTYFDHSESKKQYVCPFLNFTENVDKVREAKRLLLEDLQVSIPIKELSRKVGLNENHLKSGFKEIYGKPIYQYYKSFKNEWARRKLEDENMSIHFLASELGYSNVSHFIESFKKQHGITPKQYQLKLRSES